jgi:hypothetical protein
MNWNVGLQHAFTNTISLEVAYVGNHGKNLLGIINRNAPPVGAGYCLNNPLTDAQIALGCAPGMPPAGVAAPQIEQAAYRYFTQYPYLRYIVEIGNFDRSNYNGLQSTLTVRNSHGLNVTAGYTYAHDLDTSSLNAFYLFPVNSHSQSRNSEYGSGDFDLRHRLTAAVTYAIPGRKSPGQILQGWQVNGIVSLQGAGPWTAWDSSTDISGIGNAGFGNMGIHMGDRWDFTGNAKDFKSGGNVGIPYFAGASNTKCVAAAQAHGGQAAVNSLGALGCFVKGSGILTPPAPGTLGSERRNTFPDTGFKNVNASIYKDWKIKERFGAQFRAEFFNVFNHPNYMNPFGGVSGWGSGGTADPSTGSAGIFGCGCATPDVGAGNPVIGSGSMRAVQLGAKLLF